MTLKEVAQLIHSCNSSKNIKVLPGINSKLGFLNDIFLIILSTSNPSSKMSFILFL